VAGDAQQNAVVGLVGCEKARLAQQWELCSPRYDVRSLKQRAAAAAEHAGLAITPQNGGAELGLNCG
jgi:hypothetical protein